MGNNTSIMQLPAQSGKTRKATELMNKWNRMFELENSSGKHINIVFSSNSKLLTKQTAKRVKDEVDIDGVSDISELSDDLDSDFNGIVNDIPTENSYRTIPWISGATRMDERTIDLLIRANDIDNVICCSNRLRIRRAIALLKLLYTKHIRKQLNGRTVNIWIDEADECMKLWTSQISAIRGFDSLIHKVVLISATMGPVIKYFHKQGIDCNLRVFQNTYSDVYVKFSECEVHHDWSTREQKPIDQLCAVLDNVDIPANSRWFCPGAVIKKSHNEILNELIERGFNVLILNGDRKQLVFCEEGVEPVEVMQRIVDDGVELSEAIRNIYYEYQLYDKPFAVTGNLCVSRGITFASKCDNHEFLFTHGVIPDVSSPEEMYQMVSRCLGNFLNFDLYVAPKLYMNEQVASKIRNQEHMAIELAKRYYTCEEADIVSITPEEYNAVLCEQPIQRAPRKKNPKPEERVPLILPFGPEQAYLYSLSETSKVKKHNVFDSLSKMIAGKPEYASLLNLINDKNTILYTTAPNTENSYKKKIVDVANASLRGETYTVDIDKKEKESDKNICNVFVDKREKRLCIVMWCRDAKL